MKAPIIINEGEFKDYMKRLAEHFKNPTLMDQIVLHIENGGSIFQVAREMECSYQDLLRWIRMDKGRSQRYNEALNDRNEAVIESVLNALRAIKDFDIRDLFDDEMRLKPMNKWPEDARFAVSSIKPTELGWEVKMESRLKAIELVGKNKAMFTERIVHEAGQSLVDLISESWENGSREREAKKAIEEPQQDQKQTESSDGL